MAEKETKNNPKQLIEVTPEALETLKVEETLVSETPVVPESTSNWKPKTALGKEVKEKKITNIDDILSSGKINLAFIILNTRYLCQNNRTCFQNCHRVLKMSTF
jgi:hypothetical protein